MFVEYIAFIIHTLPCINIHYVFNFADNAILAQSRFILMEGILMFFGMFGLLCILKFRNLYKQPYTLPWFVCLILGAASLGAAVW